MSCPDMDTSVKNLDIIVKNLDTSKWRKIKKNPRFLMYKGFWGFKPEIRLELIPDPVLVRSPRISCHILWHEPGIFLLFLPIIKVGAG